MKPLALLLALALAGCASTAPPPVTDESARMDARADSLLALPPDSLSAAEWEWLRLHQGRANEEASAQTIDAAATVAVVGVVIIAGVIAFWLAVQNE